MPITYLISSLGFEALLSVRFKAAGRLGKTAAWLLVAGLTGASALAQQDFSKVQIKATKVAGNVYMLEGSGGNIGVSVGEDGIVLVDDQFAPLATKIKEALKEITDKPIKFVLNTHFHGDHTGGNVKFGAEAPIIAHENVRKRLQEGGKVAGNPVAPAPKEALPVITFNDRATVHLNGEDIRAIHFPNGHTDGDSVIFFPKSNVVHMGDDFVTYGFPFVDAQSGGSVQGMIAGVEKVLTMVPDDVRIIPGHGPISTSADVRKFIGMLKDTQALVVKAASEGKTADDMKQAHLLAKYEDDYGKGFIKADAWIDLLYAENQHRAGGQSYRDHGHADERQSSK
jgi:glyoxylase-like metal-dependent hydrolase (beta-lactamase superfamily II)